MDPATTSTRPRTSVPLAASQFTAPDVTETVTSTTAPSRLLALPREIRNIIYGHLTHSFTANYDKRTCPFIDGYIIIIENAPITNVLLASRQIHAEYLESPSSTHLHATIKLDLRPGHSYGRNSKLSSSGVSHWAPVVYTTMKCQQAYLDQQRCKTSSVLQHVKYMQVLVKPKIYRPFHAQLESSWLEIHRLVTELGPYLPNLSTIKVGLQVETKTHLEHESNPYPAFYSPSFFPEPPPTLADLKMAQKAIGYRLVVGKVILRPQDESKGTEPNLDFEFCVSKNAVYMYGEGKGNKVRNWTKDELLDAFPKADCTYYRTTHNNMEWRVLKSDTAVERKNEELATKMHWREL